MALPIGINIFTMINNVTRLAIGVSCFLFATARAGSIDDYLKRNASIVTEFSKYSYKNKIHTSCVFKYSLNSVSGCILIVTGSGTLHRYTRSRESELVCQFVDALKQSGKDIVWLDMDGEDGGPNSYYKVSVDERACLIENFINSLTVRYGRNACISVLAHSEGAFTLLSAMARGAKVDRICLLCPAFTFDRIAFAYEQSNLNSDDGVRDARYGELYDVAVSNHDRSRMGDLIAWYIKYNPPPTDSVGQLFYEMNAIRFLEEYNSPWLRSFLLLRAPVSVLRDVNVRTLVVCASDDKIVDSSYQKRWFERFAQNCVYEYRQIDGVDHFLQYTAGAREGRDNAGLSEYAEIEISGWLGGVIIK